MVFLNTAIIKEKLMVHARGYDLLHWTLSLLALKTQPQISGQFFSKPADQETQPHTCIRGNEHQKTKDHIDISVI